MRRIAAAIGATSSVVSGAFTGTWYDFDVLLDDGTEHHENPDSEGQISHLSGGCCSTPLSQSGIRI
jgi:hypothetical protein